MGQGGAAPGGAVFVGRVGELGELTSALGQAKAGRGAMILLAGEPGIGKTRLVDELVARIEAGGATVFWGRCWEGGGAPAYWPWVQILRAASAGIEDALTEAQRSDVGHIVPDLFDRRDEPRTSSDPDADRFRSFEAVAACLRAVAIRRSALVVVDDIHAADVPSLLLLRFLAADLRSIPMLLVATYRDTAIGRAHPLSEALPELMRDPSVRRMELRGLSQEDVGAYVVATAGDASDAVITAVHRETEGNPLFMSELLRLLLAEGRLEDVVNVGEHTRISVPQGVRDVIRRRVALLSERCADTLATASVLGREFGLDVLEYVAEAQAGDLLEIMDEAVASRLLSEVPAAFNRYRFSHQLVRDALYDALSTPNRIRLHRRAGAALETLYAFDPFPYLDQLAHHFFEAAQPQDLEKAAAYARRAAEHASNQLAYEEAARLFGMALQGSELSGASDERARCELLVDLGDALSRGGDDVAAKATFMRAADAARKAGSPELLARAALGYGGRFVWSRAGTGKHLVALLEDALAEPQTDHVRARILVRLACALRGTPDRERCDALSAEALEIARRLGDAVTLGYVLQGRAGAIWWPENPEERLGIAEELETVAREVDTKELPFAAHQIRSIAWAELARFHEWRKEMEEQERLAEELHQPSLMWLAASGLALLALEAGPFDEARRHIERSEMFGSRSQPVDSRSHAISQTFLLEYERGNLDNLESLLLAGAREFPWYAVFDASRSLLYAELGRREEARSLLSTLAADDFGSIPRDNEWLLVLSILVESCALLRDAGTAERLLGHLGPYAGRHSVGYAEGALGVLDRFLGLAAATCGRSDEAAEHFERALAINASAGLRVCLARTQFDYGAFLAARDAPGDSARAADLMTAALNAAKDLGMKRLASQIENAGSARAAPVVPEQGIFVREGELFSVVFAGDAARLKESKGLRYIVRLLGSPGHEIHALDLVSAEEKTRPRFAPEGDTGEVLDATAKEAYRRRLSDLEEEIDEATSWGDQERAARARGEIDVLTTHLASAVGLGGRDRKTGGAAERARVSVTRAIRAAMSRIEEVAPGLGRHLDATIRTGLFCSYIPDPRAPISWRT